MNKKVIWGLLIGIICWISPDGAFASTEDDHLLAMMRKLEARVEALEAKNSQYRDEIAEARRTAKVAVEKLKSASTASSPVRDSYASYPDKLLPKIVEPPVWSGAYWGASAGGGVTKSRVTSNEQFSENFQSNSYPFNVNGENMTDTSGPGHRGGAMIDLFGGWNFQISQAFVVGGQLEASVSDLNFNSAGTRTYSYFNAAGPTGQTAVEDFRPQVSSNWMASALFRAGLLVDAKTLIYGIGGVTLAEFEARNLADNSFYQLEESFMATGWTAGAGIERKLTSDWSVRAEYRYTNFGSQSSNGQFNFQSTGPLAGTQPYQRQAQFEQSMQVGRIGVAYAFGDLR
ncbi:outer membrane beta-barrel protein [Bradyrhizobium sp. S69]|uniref:outer membrane protein n=1 Tax=Bradyrhizobium sp. S69 TaxID=1641856 RepID=UPI00131AA330|nr:outer membrane beta-barrel protein [Bradyrhizobium sp. S69]